MVVMRRTGPSDSEKLAWFSVSVFYIHRRIKKEEMSF